MNVPARFMRHFRNWKKCSGERCDIVTAITFQRPVEPAFNRFRPMNRGKRSGFRPVFLHAGNGRRTVSGLSHSRQKGSRFAAKQPNYGQVVGRSHGRREWGISMKKLLPVAAALSALLGTVAAP